MDYEVTIIKVSIHIKFILCINEQYLEQITQTWVKLKSKVWKSITRYIKIATIQFSDFNFVLHTTTNMSTSMCAQATVVKKYSPTKFSSSTACYTNIRNQKS